MRSLLVRCGGMRAAGSEEDKVGGGSMGQMKGEQVADTKESAEEDKARLDIMWETELEKTVGLTAEG